MIHFYYKINQQSLEVITGSGLNVPEEFTEYIKGSEPQELIDALADRLLQKVKFETNNAIQAKLDETAELFGFTTGMDRAVSYKTSTNIKYSQDAVILSDWRDEIWFYYETEAEKFLNGERTLPSLIQIMNELEVNFPTPEVTSA